MALNEFWFMKKRKDTVQLFLETVGNNIRKERLKKGYTLAALGEDIGLDKANMHKIEQGKNITLITLAKISVFLEAPPYKFLHHSPDLLMEDAERYVRRGEA
jgi:transcriptional regulator with XRE-family HTH domain